MIIMINMIMIMIHMIMIIMCLPSSLYSTHLHYHTFLIFKFPRAYPRVQFLPSGTPSGHLGLHFFLHKGYESVMIDFREKERKRER